MIRQVVLNNSVSCLHEVATELSIGVLLALPERRVLLGSDFEGLRRQLINYGIDGLSIFEHLLRVRRQLVIERV